MGSGENTVRQLRQILLWPLQLAPLAGRVQIHQHWEALPPPGPGNPWREVLDEFADEANVFQQRHYNEFVTFLPYVQRFLYGEGRLRREGAHGPGGSPMRVFRRNDIAAVRLVADAGAAPVTLNVVNIELYFFYDIDIVLLKLEVAGPDLAFAQAEDVLYRFGRAYPAGWDEAGAACTACIKSNGSMRRARCWRVRTPTNANGFSRS